jgi:hypothetical protein
MQNLGGLEVGAFRDGMLLDFDSGLWYHGFASFETKPHLQAVVAPLSAENLKGGDDAGR